MTRNYFDELMQEFGCHTVEDTAFGVYKGYPFSAAFSKGGEANEILLRFVVNGSAKALVKTLRAKERPYTRWFWDKDTASGGGVLVALVQPPSDFYAKSSISTVLADAAKGLAGADLTPPQVCPLCGTGRCDRYAFVDDGYRATHQTCLDNRLDLPEQDEKQPDQPRGHWATGILGALLGAFIAIAPNWAQALSKDRLSPILYALIPVLSALCYKLCRGRANRLAALFSVLGASLAASFALELVWYWIVQTNFAGHNLSLLQTSAFYLGHFNLPLTLREMLFSLIFLAVGFFPAGVLLRRYTGEGRTPDTWQRGADFVRRSAAPMGVEKEALGEAEKAPGGIPEGEVGE